MNGEKFPREWEQISGNTERLHVPNGWLVHHFTTTIIGGKEVRASCCMTHFKEDEVPWVLENRH